ncbi:MAG TPA: type II toxin-antitoxin system VapC family toxin [Pirellulales bacterium]|nr:type II toxin-antitoxin system VapC family toxin [Pirellulales bacterium]
MTESMVVDASVVAKWFLDDEEGAAEALAILLACLAGDLELRAPPVMHIEVCNLLTKACGRRDPITKSPRLTKERAIDCIDRLFRLPIQILPGIQADAAEALAMAVDYSKTYYDMTYLLLAVKLDCAFCTADAKLLAANPADFPASRVILLSSLKSE